MTSVRMGRWPWARFGGVVLVLGLCVSAPGPATAEPSAVCRDLAARFATAATELDLQALAGLMTCVSAEMQDRTGSPMVIAPPPPSPRPREPGEWPPSQWPPSSPWGSPWPPIGPDVR